MVNILTGTPFEAVPRLHHRADEVALEGDSGAWSRRALLAARGAMMCLGHSNKKKPYIESLGTTDSFWAATCSQLRVNTSDSMHFDCEYTIRLLNKFTTSEHDGHYVLGKQQGMWRTFAGYSATGTSSSSNKYFLGKRPAMFSQSGNYVVGEEEFNNIFNVVTNEDGFFVNGSRIGDRSSAITITNCRFSFGGSVASTEVVETCANPSNSRLYSFKASQDGELVFDLVPCKEGSRVGLLNLVDNTFIEGTNVLYGEE